MNILSLSVFSILVFIFILLWKIKAFDVSALLVSLIYGYFIIEVQGVAWFMILLVFLISALYATYLGTRVKEKHSIRRGVDNVISNGLVAFISALLGMPAFFLGSIAGALADTMSSEIGVLSRSDPVLISNPKKRVPKGTNGAVSLLGLFAGLVGASIIGIMSVLLMPSEIASSRHALFFVVMVSGFSGTLMDSVLGLIENKGVLSNGTVNFAATLTSGIICAVLLRLL